MAYVEVEVDLADINTKDLIEELSKRQLTESQLDVYDNFTASSIKILVQKIFELHRQKKDYTYHLNTLFYNVLGRMT